MIRVGLVIGFYSTEYVGVMRGSKCHISNLKTANEVP